MQPIKFSRRAILKGAGLGALNLCLGARFRGPIFPAAAPEAILYVGTYTSGTSTSEGIYTYKFNSTSGELIRSVVTRGVVDPSFLTIDRNHRHLYAVNELDQFEGKPGGAISAFTIDPRTANLKVINQQATFGSAPCHVVLDPTGKFALAANYVGGSVVVLPVRRDGSLGPATDVVQHHGSSINPARQEGPHAHCVAFDLANRYVFVADLGLDKIMSYRLDPRAGKLIPNDPPWTHTKPGAGPRHIVFHPGGGFAYVINELNSSIVVYSYDGSHGVLREIQAVPTLPEGFSGTNTAAELRVSRSGRFLYGSNRGDDSLVTFSINSSDGKLTYVAREPAGGKTPRNFVLDPTGAFALVANQNSNAIIVFRIDPATGRLVPAGHSADVPSPVCIQFLS